VSCLKTSKEWFNGTSKASTGHQWMQGSKYMVAILANTTEKLTFATNKHIVNNIFYTNHATRFLKLPLTLKKLFRVLSGWGSISEIMEGEGFDSLLWNWEK
jgi:hypothetical protein